MHCITCNVEWICSILIWIETRGQKGNILAFRQCIFFTFSLSLDGVKIILKVLSGYQYKFNNKHRTAKETFGTPHGGFFVVAFYGYLSRTPYGVSFEFKFGFNCRLAVSFKHFESQKYCAVEIVKEMKLVLKHIFVTGVCYLLLLLQNNMSRKKLTSFCAKKNMCWFYSTVQ